MRRNVSINPYPIGVLLFLLTFSFGCKKGSDPEPTTNKLLLDGVTHMNWMAQLDTTQGDINLGQLTIPGTHISGADVIHLAGYGESGYATQAMPVYDQLLAGIRFLDIRLGYDSLDPSDGLILYNDEIRHVFMNEDVSLNQTFPVILSSIEAFLNMFKTETVILLIRQVHSSLSPDNFWAMVEADLTAGGFSSDRIVNYDPHKDAKLPMLSACRNKILLISMEETEKFNGLTVQWPANSADYQSICGNLQFWVQDRDMWDCIAFSEKFHDVTNMIGYARTQVPSVQGTNLFFNFVSAWDICNDPYSISVIMNTSLAQYLMEEMTSNQPCGIIITDFAGVDEPGTIPLLTYLININFIDR